MIQKLCYLASIWTIAGVVISNRFNAKPHLYEKWGLDNQSMSTSRLQVIFSLSLLTYATS